jgi:putative transposase
VIDTLVHYSPIGEVAVEAWESLPARYPYVDLDLWVLMPNHLHGIIVINEEAWAQSDDGGGS